MLAVGDLEFQQKCLGKMEDVSKSGRTILFVSHNLTAVRSFCSRAILLDKGIVHYAGTVPSTIDSYLALSKDNLGGNGVFDLTKHSGKKDVTRGIVCARLLRNGTTTTSFFSGEPFRAEFDFLDASGLNEIVFGIVIKDGNQQPLMGINNWDLGVRLNQEPVNKGTVVFECPSLPFYGNSSYYIDLYFGDGGNNYDFIENALTFKLEETAVFESGKILNPNINTVYPGKIRMSYLPV